MPDPEILSVAIHQPNFFPWLGYFKKMVNCDIFIFLDDVQLQKKAGSWTNRVKILINGKAQWITLPLSRITGTTQNINQTRISDEESFSKIFTTIEMAYGKAPFRDDTMNFLLKIFENPSLCLSEFNQNTIIDFFSFLQYDCPKIVRSSDLEINTKSTDRLVDLVIAVGGNKYLSGRGSDSYLEPEKFKNSGISLVMQDYGEHTYPQLKTTEFVPGLSVLDALMMLGPHQTLDLILT